MIAELSGMLSASSQLLAKASSFIANNLGLKGTAPAATAAEHAALVSTTLQALHLPGPPIARDSQPTVLEPQPDRAAADRLPALVPRISATAAAHAAISVAHAAHSPLVPPSYMDKRQLAEYNALNSALWYFPYDAPRAESVSVSIGDTSLPAANVLVDPGAGIALISEAFCQRHNLEYDRNPVRLSGACGGMQVQGSLRSPVQLTFFKGTQLENTVTIAGPESNPDHVTTLVSKGVSHLYDLLLGNSVLRRAGGRLDTCTGQLDMRPFLQTHGDTVHMATIQLRPHALPYSASKAIAVSTMAA
jgi:hypothetical protein